MAGQGGKRGRVTLDWSALIAALIGLLALCVSAYTANVQRQQAKAQVWTRLYFAHSDNDRTLMVLNKGVGPARVESLRLYVDGKPRTHWQDVFEALGLPSQSITRQQSSLNGVVLAAGERLDYLKLPDAQEWAAFRAQKKRVDLRACYCSVLDECLMFDERGTREVKGARSANVTPVARCEPVENEEFDE